MFTIKSALTAGDINVVTSQNGPLSAEQWATLATEKIISVGNQTEGPIRDQALAYQGKIQKIIEYYIKEALRSQEKHLLTRRF
jgi:hypothetical protein